MMGSKATHMQIWGWEQDWSALGVLVLIVCACCGKGVSMGEKAHRSFVKDQLTHHSSLVLIKGLGKEHIKKKLTIEIYIYIYI